jgi:hypothetical protein
MDMAVPIKAGIVKGISGNIAAYRSVTNRAVKETRSTITRSYFTLLNIYHKGILLFKSIIQFLFWIQR